MDNPGESASGNEAYAALAAAFTQAPIGLALTSLHGEVLLLNHHLTARLGPAVSGILEQAVRAVLDQLTGNDSLTVPVGKGLTAQVQRVTRPNGTPGWLLVTVSPDHQGVDPLTGLPGRNQLLDRLTHALARRTPHPLQLAVVDLDRFKPINDRYGHLIGDQILVAVANRLLATVRPQDTVCRWGGDEFILLLEDAADAAAAAVCQRLTAALSVPCHTWAGPILAAASCGWVGNRDGESSVAMLHRADLRMYEVKHARRQQEQEGSPTSFRSPTGV